MFTGSIIEGIEFPVDDINVAEKMARKMGLDKAIFVDTKGAKMKGSEFLNIKKADLRGKDERTKKIALERMVYFLQRLGLMTPYQDEKRTQE